VGPADVIARKKSHGNSTESAQRIVPDCPTKPPAKKENKNQTFPNQEAGQVDPNYTRQGVLARWQKTTRLESLLTRACVQRRAPPETELGAETDGERNGRLGVRAPHRAGGRCARDEERQAGCLGSCRFRFLGKGRRGV
jgi:hypothetical protein